MSRARKILALISDLSLRNAALEKAHDVLFDEADRDVYYSLGRNEETRRERTKRYFTTTRESIKRDSFDLYNAKLR